MSNPWNAGKITAIFALVLVLSISLSPAASANQGFSVDLQPEKSLENSAVVYTLKVTNASDSSHNIDNVRVAVPAGFTAILDNDNVGWSYSLSGGEITYKTTTDSIAPDDFRIFKFQATTPDFENAIRQEYILSVTTPTYILSGTISMPAPTYVVPAIFSSSGHSDNGSDVNNNGKFDYLTVNVKLNVSTAGLYKVSGALYDNSNDNYVVWADSGYENLPAGVQTVQLKFKSGNIQKLGKTTFYKAKVDLYDNSMQLLDNFAYVTQTPYNSSNFDPPAATFSSPHSFDTVDQDADDLYDYLILNAKENVASAGTYRVSAYLQDTETGNYITWGESNLVSLPAGSPIVQVKFDGSRIRQARISGHYKAYMWLYDENWLWLDSSTYVGDNFYCWENFEHPVAEFTSMSDQGVDLENDNLFDYLALDATASVGKSGTYWINYYLYENSTWSYIGADSQKENLTSGIADHIVISEFATRGASSAYDEFVELYNPTDKAVNLTNWTIEYYTSSWTHKMTIDNHPTIPAHGYYLTSSAAQYFTTTTADQYMTNYFFFADDGRGIRIKNSSGTVVDTVFFEGSGNTSNAEAEGGKTAPRHGTAPNDNSVERKALSTSTAATLKSGGADATNGNGYDSDNNYNDWVKSNGRNPQNSSSTEAPAWSAKNDNISVHIDGSLIRSAQKSGYYRVIFYLYDENWNWLGYYEYVTENSYNWSSFEPSGAEISSISDWGEDTDSNGKYDYLVVKANLSVYQPGTYSVSGELRDGEDNCIGWAYSENTLSSNGQVTLRFDGTEIRQSKINGPCTVELQLGKAPDTWLSSYENTTATYNWTDFDSSTAEIQSMTYSVEDTNANGKYDYLVADVNLNVEGAGIYKASGSLYSYTSSTWITWADNEFELSASENVQFVQLRFSGAQIRSAQKSDNYIAYISLYDADQNWLGTSENISKNYSWTDFEFPAIVVENTADFGENTDSDNYFNYLVENLSLTVNKSGTYHISASLYKNYNWITSAWVDNYVENGENRVVQLRFDGVSIYSSHENGPYTVNIWISDETWNHVTDNQDNTGSNYYAENFQRPPAVIAAAGHTDNGIDTDNDDNYNYLYVGVKVNVTTAGKYRLNGSLLDNTGFWIDWADNEISLGSGDNQTVGLFFTGNRIRTSGKSGPYSVQVYLSKSGTGEYGYGGMGLDSKTLTTGQYSWDDFDYPPIEFSATNSDNVVDTDGDGFYDYLVVNVGVRVTENGTYHLGGSLSTQWLQRENSTPTPSVWITWADNEFELSASENVQFVQLRFSGAQIRRVNENGPYKADIYLSGTSGGKWNWFGSSTYTTNQYYCAQFQRMPLKVRPPYSDYGLDTDGDNQYDFIVVRLKVDVLKAGKYLVGASLWPAGYLQETKTLSVGDNQTVELRFPTSKLNKSHTPGPYSVYFNFMDENWSWLDSGSYQTKTYTYAQFDPPRVELVQPVTYGNVTYGNVKISDAGLDADNDNLYDFLTVDVSVKVVENGTYKLRGSLIAGNMAGTPTFDWVENNVYLTVNDNTVRLRFDGYGIAASGLDGRISMNLIITDENGRWLDSGYTYTNASYSSSQFENTKTRSFAIVAGKSVPPSSAGGTVSVDLENTDLGSLTSVDLKARQDRSSSSVISVTEQNTAPPGAEDVSGENLGYFDITVSDYSSIQSATIHFKILKSLVAALNIDIDNIKLMRENSLTGNWVELETTLENEDDNYYYFSATTPGFSCFVVVGVVQADFSVGLSSSSATVQQGSSTSATVNVTTSTAYSYAVTLSASGAPAGVSIGFSTSSSTPDFSSTMTITVGSSTSAGIYNITVTGTGADSTTHSTIYSLTVSAAGSVEPPGEEAPPVVAPEVNPATFEFSVFRIPDVIKVGETATITFTITNTGDLPGTYTAILTLDGAVIQTKELTILAGASQEVSFDVVPPANGTYIISIAGQTASLVVSPELAISQDLIAITAPAVYASEINIDAPAVFDVSETSITQIALSVSASMENVVLRVRQLLDKPEEVAAPEGNVYKYLEIVAEKVTNDNITSAAITFKVEKSWIENENIDPNTVTLRRYHSGQWQDLVTDKIREDNTYIYYVAVTPGFSIFAVSGSRAETSTAGPPGITPTMPTQPFSAVPPVLLVAVTAIMLIAVILVVIWRYVSLGTKTLTRK